MLSIWVLAVGRRKAATSLLYRDKRKCIRKTLVSYAMHHIHIVIFRFIIHINFSNAYRLLINCTHLVYTDM